MTLVPNEYQKGFNKAFELTEMTILELREENKRLKFSLHQMLAQLNLVPCYMGCNNGVVKDSEDDIYQCQWCGEQEEARNLLKLLNK